MILQGIDCLLNYLTRFSREKQAKIDVAKLAKLANLSPSRFHAVFKQLTGAGPMEHHKKLRLGVAFRLVTRGDDKLKLIAEKTGFCNEFHLSRDFKRNYGKSPKEYMKKEFKSLV